MKTRNWLAAGFLGWLSFCGTASAATMVLKQGVSPTVGYNSFITSIRSDTPGTNLNGGANLILGNLASGADVRILFAFDLSSLGGIGSATINSVQLSLNTANDSSSQSAAFQIDLLPLTAAFVETSATWNTTDGSTAWATAGGDFSSGTLLSSITANPNTGTSGGSNAWTFGSSANFASAAQTAFDSGGQTLYFIAKLNDESTTTRRIFQILGDENVSTTVHPALTIDYTAIPEPSTYALLAMGLGSLYVLRRRFSRRTSL